MAGEGKPDTGTEERHGANSPLRVNRADRAPRLRRVAQMLEERAEHSSDPDAARELACKMRLRAAAIETGGTESDKEAMARLMAEMNGDEDEGAAADFLRSQLPRQVP